MNMTIQQQPFSYPVYMDASRLPLSVPWSSASFHSLPAYQQTVPSPYPMLQPSLPPFVLHHQRSRLPKKISSSASFSNTRYNHLKQSASYSSRRPPHRSVDMSARPHRHSLHADSIHSRSSKTRSTSDLAQFARSSSGRLPKSHSWHTIANHHPSNLSVGYAKEMQLTPRPRRKRSLRKKTKMPLQRSLPSSPKRKASFRRKPSIHLPERGVVRISTLDEMPIANHRTNQRTKSINNDRISTKGSISNSSQRQRKSKGSNSIESRSIPNDDEETRIDSDIQSSSSSSSDQSHSSLQQRLNGSLRNDPLIIAAMEDYRQLQRSSSQTTSMTSRRRDVTCDSQRSNSILHSSSSDSHSQSSFTSVERSEIRQLIKTTKTKGSTSLDNPIHSSPIPTSASPSEQSVSINYPPSVSTGRPRKSSLTEELDREFNKLRALTPSHEINCVTPSSICRRKKTLEKPSQPISPLPTFDQLLRQVKLRPIEKSTRSLSLKERSNQEHYENPLESIPVPRSSPLPAEEIKPKDPLHEYAIPIKRNEEKKFLPQISHFQPSRNFKFSKSVSDIPLEKRALRSLSMFNWFHHNLTNPFPTTFQPNRITNNPNEYTPTSVTENIYTADIDVYSSSSPTVDKIDDHHSLQIHLENQTILTDDMYSDDELKQTTNSSSILDDFSHLLTRKHKHENKSRKRNQRCSIM